MEIPGAAQTIDPERIVGIEKRADQVNLAISGVEGSKAAEIYSPAKSERAVRHNQVPKIDEARRNADLSRIC